MVYMPSYDELVMKQGREEGREEGKRMATLSLVQRQLTRRLGELNWEVLLEIEQLSGEKLENLSEALLDFQQMADLVNWLANS